MHNTYFRFNIKASGVINCISFLHINLTNHCVIKAVTIQAPSLAPSGSYFSEPLFGGVDPVYANCTASETHSDIILLVALSIYLANLLNREPVLANSWTITEASCSSSSVSL